MCDCASAPQAPTDCSPATRHFERAFLALPAGVSVYSADECLVLTNPAFRALYGLSETTLREGMPANVVLRAIGAPHRTCSAKPSTVRSIRLCT